MAGRHGRLTWRLAGVIGVLALATVGIVVRLTYVQIIHHDRYTLEAQAEHFDKRLIYSSRGAILDRNGYPLATSVDAFDIYVDRRVWKDEAAAPVKTAQALAPVLGVDVDGLIAKLEDPDAGSVSLIADSVDYDVGRAVEALGLRDVQLAQATKRFYPEGDVASGLLGFLGREHKGLAGLEADLDDTLNGVPGALYFERDSVGDPIAFGERSEVPGKPGADVRLTIDRYLQQLVEEELDRQITAHQASGGTIIVMDPKTGAILAMASRPGFRLSQLNLDDPNFDLYRNRAVSDVYEPGSVMKSITMATAVDLGLVNPNTTYYDAGVVTKGGYTFHNWDFSANGTQTMTQLLQKSLNTGAIWLSDLIGADRLYASLQNFGFGESTHSGFGGEALGILRTNTEPGWYSADLATNSYGQGIAATPLQLITAISALVNGGNLMRPYVVAETNGPAGDRVFEPVVVRRVISQQTSQTMVQMLNDVVEGVPYHGARIADYHVGGKTGTTLVSIPTGYALDSTIASFVGFAPVSDPQMIMLVKIDQPKDDPLGGVVAAPVFAKLAPRILAYLGVPPTDAHLIRGGP